MMMMKRKSFWMVAAASVIAAACGGGGGPPPATELVPVSASESVTGFVSYLKALVVSAADTLEPVDASMLNPPLDETGEPATVD